MEEYQNALELQNQDSEIPKNSSSNLATKISIKETEHYLCKDCKTFHLIDIFKLDTIKIKILCDKKEIYSKDLTSNILKVENLDIYQFCQLHTGYKKIGFCSECKSDLCQECIKLKNCKNNQNLIKKTLFQIILIKKLNIIKRRLEIHLMSLKKNLNKIYVKKLNT